MILTVHSKSKKVFIALNIAAIIGVLIVWVRLHLLATPLAAPTLLPYLSTQHKGLQSPSRLLPHKYWKHRNLHPEKYNQVSCSNFPRLEDIHYAAASWQHLRVESGSVYLYGAYWDDRFGEPLVRVLVYCDVAPLPPLICQLWYENENAPTTIPATVTYGWQPAWGGPTDRVNEPYILACRARRHSPDMQRAPAAVSIVRKDLLCGTPTNVLNIQGAPLPDTALPPVSTTSVTVCVKWMKVQNDLSAELVEWIELIKALGADHLFISEIQSHPNTRRVLDYYVDTGFADITPFAHAPQLRSNFTPAEQDFHDWRRDLLPLNDCLYRSMHQYQWIAAIDRDEIIVPQSLDTWQQIISQETRGIEGLDAMAFRNYYFLDGAQRDLAAPPYMKILGHLWRAREPNSPGFNVKSFHNTSSVVAMHNHYPMSCGARSCWSRNVNETIARLHHYRGQCGDGSADCPAMHDIVRDETITKWKHVMEKVDQVLATLRIKPKV